MPRQDPSTIVTVNTDPVAVTASSLTSLPSSIGNTSIVVNETINNFTTVTNVTNNPNVDLGNITAKFITAQSATPVATVIGQSYFDVDDGALYVWSGTSWVYSGGTATASTVSFAAAGNVSALNVQDAITELDTEKVPLNGGVMTGLLTLSGDPTSSLHAATKQYVISDAGTGTYAPSGNLIGVTLSSAITELDVKKLSLTGGTVTGSLVVSNDVTVTGNLTVTGTTITADVTTIKIEDPVIEQGGNVTGTLTTNDGKDRGQLLHYFTTTPVAAFMGWDNSAGEFAFGSDVTNSSEVMTFNSYGNVRAGNFIGSLSGAATTAGTVTTAAQPNITSVGTLTSLSVTGAVTGGSFAGDGSALSLLTGANVTGEVGFSAVANSVALANVTGAGTIAPINLSGVATEVLLGDGTWATANAGTVTTVSVTSANGFAGTVATAGTTPAISLSTTVTGMVMGDGTALSSATAGTDYVVPSGSITGSAGSVTNAVTFAVTGGAAAGSTFDGSMAVTVDYSTVGAPKADGTNATGTWSIDVTGSAGTVTTASQPNITSVGTLTSLDVTGAVTGGSFAGDGSALSAITGANVTGTVATATTADTVTTAAQPNITSVGTLTSLDVTGAVTGGSFAGDGSALSSITGANVTGTVSAATTAGTVTTAAQPNITSVGTLTSLDVTGVAKAGSLETTQTAAAITAAAVSHTVPIVINGVTYYMMLSTVP